MGGGGGEERRGEDERGTRMQRKGVGGKGRLDKWTKFVVNEEGLFGSINHQTALERSCKCGVDYIKHSSDSIKSQLEYIRLQVHIHLCNYCTIQRAVLQNKNYKMFSLSASCQGF